MKNSELVLGEWERRASGKDQGKKVGYSEKKRKTHKALSLILALWLTRPWVSWFHGELHFLIHEHVLSTSQGHLQFKWENVSLSAWKSRRLYIMHRGGLEVPTLLHYPVYFSNSPLNLPDSRLSHPLHTVRVQEGIGFKSSQRGTTGLNSKSLVDPSRKLSSFLPLDDNKETDQSRNCGMPSWGQKGRIGLRTKPTLKEKTGSWGLHLSPG